jgi:hypothetical protein
VAQNRASKCISAGQRQVTRVGATGCKTVGSAYDGSNPSPATTSGNGPLAGIYRLGGPFCYVPPCVIAGRWGPGCCGVHGHMADGVGAARTVGVHRRLSTDGHGRAALAACSGLTCVAEPGMSPCARPSIRGHPGPGGLGKAGALTGTAVRERDSCRAGLLPDGAGSPPAARRDQGCHPGTGACSRARVGFSRPMPLRVPVRVKRPWKRDFYGVSGEAARGIAPP